MARILAISAQKGKVLFILDGLDEIVADTGGIEGKAFQLFLRTLLSQHHVVITSRPSGLDSKLLPPLDLELETVGFSQQNVSDFIVKVLEPEAAKTVQDFIRRTPLIQGLVNIPVQLDVICFSWDSLPRDGLAITMTGLYQLMVRKLWCKDALRLKKTAGGLELTEQQIHGYEPEEIDELMAVELQHLGYLAFKGMNNNHQIEFGESDLRSAFRDLRGQAIDNQLLSPPQLVDIMKQTSFLHTADADLTSRIGGSRQAWHFLHLTFQEYFAATWIVRHFHFRQPCSSAGMMTMDQVTAFIHRHKYTPQYEIVWTMVAGLLEREPLRDFFGIFQGAPRDVIGGRHQQVLAYCLNEARARLDSTVVKGLDEELRNWLQFEMQTCQHDEDSRSMLGSQLSFPEASLIDTLCSVSSWKPTLVQTLETRSIFSDSVLQFLTSALQDDHERTRSSAVSFLGKNSKLPEWAIQPLIAALKDEDWFVRSSAAGALGIQSVLPEIATKSLIIALQEDDDMFFFGSPSSSALSKQSTTPESAIQSLIVTLKDEDETVRPLAASVLGSRSTLPESVIQYVTTALQDDNMVVRSSAVRILYYSSMLPESLMLYLIAALKDGDREVRTSAVLALGNKTTLPESAIQSLNAALKDDDPKVRSSAVSALSKQSSLSESVIQSLNNTLQDEHEDVRCSAVYALDRRSSLPESSIQPLVDTLKDENKRVRHSAAYVLGRQATLPESVVQYLIAALKEDDGNTKYSAATAFGYQSTLPELAIQPLIVALENGDADIRSSAAWALHNKLSLPESAIHSLIVALKDENREVRIYAAWTLGMQSSLPESAIWALFAAEGDKDAHVRESASEALDKQSIFSESIDQYLVYALKDDDQEVRSSAAWRLGKQPLLRESAILSLVTALQDDDKWVRVSAVSALCNQSTPLRSAIELLIAALEDGDVEVRNSLSDVLRGQYHALCTSLPNLTQEEIACVYENHLFQSSCRHVLYLQEQDGKLCLYTEKDVLHLATADNDLEEKIISAFRSVQQKAGIKS